VGAGVFALVANSKFIERQLARAINWALRRWTDLDTRDYVSLLDLAGKYTVREMQVEEGDWLAGKTLKTCRLPDAGITVLGITRGTGGYVGVPTAETLVSARDVLVLYGHADALAELDKRRAGPPGNSAGAGPAAQQEPAGTTGTADAPNG
jgi:Trk K+ transport system NAD-binding subunit